MKFTSWWEIITNFFFFIHSSPSLLIFVLLNEIWILHVNTIFMTNSITFFLVFVSGAIKFFFVLYKFNNLFFCFCFYIYIRKISIYAIHQTTKVFLIMFVCARQKNSKKKNRSRILYSIWLSINIVCGHY